MVTYSLAVIGLSFETIGIIVGGIAVVIYLAVRKKKMSTHFNYK